MRMSSNDLWMAIAERLGMPGFTLGDDDLHTRAITGLFGEAPGAAAVAL
jgi:hypothetical protein